MYEYELKSKYKIANDEIVSKILLKNRIGIKMFTKMVILKKSKGSQVKVRFMGPPGYVPTKTLFQVQKYNGGQI